MQHGKITNCSNIPVHGECHGEIHIYSPEVAWDKLCETHT